MQPAHTSTLLIDELTSLLKESGNLFGLALDAQNSSTNLDAMEALAWYLFNLKQCQEVLALAAGTVPDDNVKTMSAYLLLTNTPPSADRHISLHDLKEVHDKFRISHSGMRLAYNDYIHKYPYLQVLFNSVDNNLRMATINLKQALDIR